MACNWLQPHIAEKNCPFILQSNPINESSKTKATYQVFNVQHLSKNTTQEWLASSFSLHHQWITYKCHEIKGNDHQLKKLLIVRRILLVSTQRTVWRMWILMLEFKGLRVNIWVKSQSSVEFCESFNWGQLRAFTLSCHGIYVQDYFVLWIELMYINWLLIRDF